MPDLSGKLALVTGASSGLGAAMARRLASWRCDLVLTARRLDRLEALAAELTAAHGIAARAIREDLAEPDGAARLYAAATAERPLDILINNAGIAAFEYYADTSWDRHRAILQLDVVSLCDLAWRASRDMTARGGRGYILNIASTAGISPVIGFTTYGAAKAFVLNFSQALAAELAGTGVTVTAIAPGPVATEFIETAGMKVAGLRRLALMNPDRCAAVGLRAMLRGRRLVAPGVVPKIMLYGHRLTPTRLNGLIGGLLLGAPSRRPAAIGKPSGPG